MMHLQSGVVFSPHGHVSLVSATPVALGTLYTVNCHDSSAAEQPLIFENCVHRAVRFRAIYLLLLV
jgi:hypothetical protein